MCYHSTQHEPRPAWTAPTWQVQYAAYTLSSGCRWPRTARFSAVNQRSHRGSAANPVVSQRCYWPSCTEQHHARQGSRMQRRLSFPGASWFSRPRLSLAMLIPNGMRLPQKNYTILCNTQAMTGHISTCAAGPAGAAGKPSLADRPLVTVQQAHAVGGVESASTAC